MTLTTLVITALAVWRLSHALVKEDGPLMVFARLRGHLARSQKLPGGLFDAISCTSCISLWIGLTASLFISYDFLSWIAYGFAISGVAVLIEDLTHAKV